MTTQRRTPKTLTKDSIKYGRFANPEYALNHKRPTFTLKQVRDTIPAHCFKRDTIKSLSYVALDLLMIASLVLFATKINTFPDFLQIPAWLFYFVFQGFVGVGIWILAHECGHGAFSDYTTLNSVVGWVLHSIDLIPFFSWKYTHAKHHKATGHMTKDMVFIPSTRSMLLGRDGRAAEYQGPVDPMIEDEEHLLEETPLYAVLFLTGILLAGFPAYLLYNLGGQPQKQWVSHYFPNAPIFDAHQYRGVVISNIGLLLWISILTTIGYLHGFMIPFLYFVVPWMQVNAWLVVITYLQHTDGKIPRYNNDEFDFLRGALATVDRDWGFLNAFFHHITDTHVVHHLFSTMPFYNAQEATNAVKGLLGEFYVEDHSPIPTALWHAATKCRFVEDEGDVLFYKY